MKNLRPNTRVRRTRSSASPPRSPLTRHPLGRSNLASAFRVIAPFVIGATTALCRSVSPEQPFDVGAGGLPSFSGTWKGGLGEKKAGSCDLALRNDWRFRTTELTHTIRAEWLVEPDGAFTLRQFMDDDTEPTEWSGVVDSTLRVTGVLVTQAACKGADHESHTNLSGRVVRGANEPVLRLSGQQITCPDLGCVFDSSYDLTKQK